MRFRGDKSRPEMLRSQCLPRRIRSVVGPRLLMLHRGWRELSRRVDVGAAEYERRGVDRKRAICLAYSQAVGIPDWQTDAGEMMQINGLNPPAAFEGIYGPLELKS